MKKAELIYPYVYALFCGSFLLNGIIKIVPNLILGVLIALFIIVVKKRDFQKLKSKSFIILSAFVILVSTIILLTYRLEDLTLVSKLWSIIVIVILSIPITHYKIILKTYVIIAWSVLVISFMRILNHVISYDSFNLTSGEIVNDLLLGERPYMAFMYAVATVLSGYLGVITRKKFWFLFSICFIAFIIYISARIALVSIIFVALMGVIYLKKSSLISVGIIMLVISIIVGVLTLNENVRQRFLISNINENSHLKEKLIFEPRYHIWECTSHLNQNATSILVGKGFKNTTKELVECYKNRTEFYTEDQKNWFIQSEFNTHNQYLGLYWSSGLISLLAFISFLLFTCMEHRKNYFAISLLMVLMFFLLTENMLHRQLGAMLISLVYVFVNFISTPRSELKDID